MILPTSMTTTAYRKDDVGYLRLRVGDGELSRETLAYLRVRVDGFELYVGWENMGTPEQPKFKAVTKPEVAWVTPINKDGTPIDGAPIYQVNPDWLIQPGLVKQDVKEMTEKAVEGWGEV